MLRAILAVVAGFIVMFAVTMLIFSSALLFGLENVFRPGEYMTTTAWNIGTLVGGFIAALLGGWVCARIARGRVPVIVLACLVLVLGGVSAAGNLMKPQPGPRTGPITLEDMKARSKEPNWYALLLPAVSVAGVLVGGRRRLKAEG